MKRISLRTWLAGALLGVALTMTLFASASYADCSTGDPTETCAGDLMITGAGPSSVGELVYEDFKAVENRARGLMQRNIRFREDISPYRENNRFDELVSKFDTAGGWSAPITLTLAAKYTETVTLQGRIDQADGELREARDLYAYLLTIDPQQYKRIEKDPYYSGALCKYKEEPNPPDPKYSGQVLDPVINWCDFGARLRQAVRESVNIRMIFGQQFVVDAMGPHFSGADFAGGEKIVRQEVAKLRAAQHQYQQAEIGLQEAMTHTVGNGCVVSDYYTPTEWALLSKAAESQETAQHEIAVRQSYLGDSTPAGVQIARAEAGDTFRNAAIEGYAKMVRVAAMAQYPAAGYGCGQGVAPDAQLATDMALALQETRNRANEMAEGRNIFGLDVTFTPYRPYYLPPTSLDEGLWNEAMRNAEYASKLEQDEELKSRVFDETQKDLRDAILQIKNSLDMEISNQLGCSNTGAADDDAFFACAEDTMKALTECEKLVYVTPDAQPGAARDVFEQCMDRVDADGNPLIPLSDARQSLYELRSQVISLHGIKVQAEDVYKRIQLSNQRSARVKTWLGISGGAQTASEVSGAMLDMLGASEVESKVENKIDPAVIAKNQAVAAVGVANIALKAVAGALSTAADVEMEDAENTEQVQSMLLEQSELYIAAASAQHGVRAKVVEFEGILGHMDDVINETKRQRAYVALSPGNDPSYRIVRDSKRMELAKQYDKARELAYLAARRAEYEYAGRLSANRGFRISDIYRARIATEMITFLNTLRQVTNNLATGQTSSALNTTNLKISVAQDILGLTDEALAREGFKTPGAIRVEREKRFRQWVAEHTVPNNFESPYDGKPVLSFSFSTSLLDGGVFSRLMPQGYDRYWIVKVGGIGEPKAGSTGLSLNLVTKQPRLSYQIASITQAGMTHLKAQSGCIFDYKLVAPAFMLGLDWPSNQDAHEVEAVLNANVNDQHAYAEEGFRTPAFMGRPASATEWRVLVFTGSPARTRDTEGALWQTPDMELWQLTDIELNMSVTYASRTPGEPTLAQCTRIDY